MSRLKEFIRYLRQYYLLAFTTVLPILFAGFRLSRTCDRASCRGGTKIRYR